MSADLLRKAAAKLRETAEPALEDLRTNRYWSSYPKPSAWHDGMTNGLGGPSGDFAALMNPALAEPLAEWLDEAASQYDGPKCDAPHGCCNNCESRFDFVVAIDLARTILGEVTDAR